MADPVRPDPATRDLLDEILGHLSGPTTDHRWDEYGEFVRTPWLRADQVCTWGQKLAALQDPPPLPDEPPDGAICRGYGSDIWFRDDAAGLKSSSTWWLNGDSHRYGEALDKGLTPGRRLVELPADDRIEYLADLLNVGIRATHSECITAVRAILRALAERGNHDG